MADARAFLNLNPLPPPSEVDEETKRWMQEKERKDRDNLMGLKRFLEVQIENNATYQGTTDGTTVNKVDATTAPTTSNDEGEDYSVGSKWIDITNDVAYICLDATAGAAVWTEVDDTDDTAIHDNVAGEINAITEKATPVSADLVIIEDSAASNAKKKAQVGNLASSDSDAIHDNVASEISAITEKVSPVNADMIVIEDSAAANVKKMVQAGNLPTGVTFSSAYVDITTDSDAVDVSGATHLVIVRANTGSNNITIGGLSGGTDKQMVLILKTSGSNILTLENNEATGTEKITTHTGSDVSRTAGQYGGWLLFFWSGASQPWKIIHD